MRTALVISASAHALVLGAALFSFAAPPPLEMPPQDVVPIEIVPVEDVARAVKGETEAELAAKPTPKPTTKPPREEPAANIGDTEFDVPAPEAPPAKRPPVEAAAPPPPPPPEAEPEAKPEPAPKEVALLDRPTVPKVRPTFDAKPEPKPEPPKADAAAEKAEAAKKAEAKRKADAKAKDRAKKKADAKAKAQAAADAKANEDKIKALLDKQKPTSGGAKRSTETASLGTKKGKAGKLSRSELDGLRAQVQSCFGVPAVGGVDPAALRVTLEFDLDRDGTLKGRPRVLKSAGPDARSKRTFASAAKRAVTKCGRKGFDLPADKFETWSQVEANFSLADML